MPASSDLPPSSRRPSPSALRRDLGKLEAYALLVGILVGAGIFRVTSNATALTGPSVILGHLVLAPAILASAVAYVVFLSTSLGETPGGEVLHVSRTFGSRGLAFFGGWLKLISYLGAEAFLARALAEHVLALTSVEASAPVETLLSLACLTLFTLLHVAGARWLGRAQVVMCAGLAIAILVLVVPGAFAVELQNLRPFFTGGARGFVASLAPLFFAYAGFESLAQAAGEVRDSRASLPGVFVRGIVATTVIFVAMTVVAFGSLPAAELEASATPMTDAAARFLPAGTEAIVTLGAILAIATSLNATILVPARLAWALGHERVLPGAFRFVHVGSGVPLVGLGVGYGIAVVLLVTGEAPAALGIAVLALVLLYGLHSVALLALPRCNSELYAEVQTRVPRGLQVVAGGLSVLAMAALALVQIGGDLRTLLEGAPFERWSRAGPSATELLVAWGALGAGLYVLHGRKAAPKSARPR